MKQCAWVAAAWAAAAWCGCAPAQLPAATDARTAAPADVIDVPVAPALALLPRVRVATDLANPRGMLVEADGSLLVSIAGTGDPGNPLTGGLQRLRDSNSDGDFDDPGERTTLLDKQPSSNLLHLVRRDEVFGMASIAAGEGSVLVSLAEFGGPSKIFRLEGATLAPWGDTHGNINNLVFDERRKVWVGVASTTDEVVELLPGGRSQRVVKFPPLKSGQDAVPADLRFDARSGDLLVTLFSGSPEGEEGGEGVELVNRSASISRVHAETHSSEPFLTGLTVPTGIELGADGAIYVLEFCDSFLDPVKVRQDMFNGPMHGGFKRYSGRLLKIDREKREVTVIAQGLDAPTNLARAGDYLYIAEGMGTPGRLIPGPDGKPVPLVGFIERIALK